MRKRTKVKLKKIKYKKNKPADGDGSRQEATSSINCLPSVCEMNSSCDFLYHSFFSLIKNNKIKLKKIIKLE